MAVMIAALLAISASILGASSARADITLTPEVRERIHKSTVMLRSSYVYRAAVTEKVTYTVTMISQCTGSFVSTNGDILTAGHCVDENDVNKTGVRQTLYNALVRDFPQVAKADLEKLALAATLTYTGGKTEARQPQGMQGAVLTQLTEVVVSQGFVPFKSGDLAHLKLNGYQIPNYLQVAGTAPQVGDEIVAVGFPGSVTNTVDAATQTVSFNSGRVSSEPMRRDGGAFFVSVDAKVSQGMSGGPVVNASGEIVGTNSWTATGGADAIPFMTTLESVKQFLTRNGVSVTTAPAPQPSSSDAPLPVPAESAPANDQGGSMLIWVIVAVAVLVVVIAYVVLRGRSKVPAQGQQPQQVHPSQVWPGPQQPPQFGNPPQGWQPNGPQQFPGQQPNVPPPAQGWPPNNGTPPQ